MIYGKIQRVARSDESLKSIFKRDNRFADEALKYTQCLPFFQRRGSTTFLYFLSLSLSLSSPLVIRLLSPLAL